MPSSRPTAAATADGIIARIASGVDLLLTKTAAPEPVATGGTLTYTLTVTNSATDPAISVTVTDPLPAGLTFASCVATAGGVCGGTGNTPAVAYPSLAAGASSTVTITATVTAAMGATLVNTATVTSASFEPNTANNIATATSHTPGVNPSDTDNDALPNDWETRFGLDPNSGTGVNGAGGDPDADGRTNFQELQEGSHPRGFVITYLAEGATGTFFDTRLALANPTATTAHVLARYQKDDGTVVSDVRTMAPFSRLTIDVDGVGGMANVAFSSLVEADVQVVADRTMTWGTGGYGSHAERGVLTRTATTWYLAEGATHGSFDLFYLIQNPGPAAAAVEIAYLRPAPLAPIIRTYTVAPHSRHTIRVDDVPGLAESDVSAAIRTTNAVPIIVERAMYFTRPDQVYAGGHESAGVTAPQTRWFLAEGATGSFFNMFILLANPSPDPATVQMDYLLTSGQTVTRTHTVGASNRLTLNVALEAPELGSANMSTVVTSTNNVPIVVERAMWWPAPGVNWQEGHNSPGEIVTGPRWAMGEGETGGAQGTQTYVLIANTSAFAGSARVTLLFEDGTTTQKVFALPATSRTNISVQGEFPAAADRRFGALVESLGDDAGRDRGRARDVRQRQRHRLRRGDQRPRDPVAVKGSATRSGHAGACLRSCPASAPSSVLFRQRREPLQQPGFRDGPVALHRRGRDVEGIRRFGDVEAGEVAQLDDAAQSLVEGVQLGQRLVEREDVYDCALRADGDIVEPEHRDALSALLCVPPPRVVDQDLAHQPRRHSEEMRAVAQCQPIETHEPDVRLVHERRGLQCMVRRLVSEPRAGHAAQLRVNQGDQPCQRRFVAAPPFGEQLRHVAVGGASRHARKRTPTCARSGGTTAMTPSGGVGSRSVDLRSRGVGQSELVEIAGQVASQTPVSDQQVVRRATTQGDLPDPGQQATRQERPPVLRGSTAESERRLCAETHGCGSASSRTARATARRSSRSRRGTDDLEQRRAKRSPALSQRTSFVRPSRNSAASIASVRLDPPGFCEIGENREIRIPPSPPR